MNKINVLFLSSLMVAGSGAFGMQAIRDFRKGVTDARANVKATADNSLPNRMVENASDEIKGLNKDVKGLKKETDNIVNSVFELSETLASFGGYKQRYNSHINALVKLKADAKQGDELDFDEADFKDLIDQEAETLKKQKAAPVARQNRNVKQQPAQRGAIMANHVAQLKRSVEAFNTALDNQVNVQPRAGRRAAAPVVNRVADARKALNTTIEKFQADLEAQREAVCQKSTLGEVVYGGSDFRSLATLAVMAVGAWYLGQSMNDSETGRTVKGWFAQGREAMQTAFTGIFNWIATKLA